MLIDNDLFATLQLIRSKNLGKATFYKLREKYGDSGAIVKNFLAIKNDCNLKSIELADPKIIEEEIKAVQKIGAEIITLDNKNYPNIFHELENLSPILTILGNKELLNKDSLAIVGARNASASAYRFTYNIAKDLAKEFTVVSGLARGIDTAAHNGALESGTTIAVTACGIDIVYPKENEDLYFKIRNKGLIVTEMPFNSAPIAQNFPRRNEIISGLALGIVVIEAGLKSGSLITADIGLKQNKDIFAVPGSPMDPRCLGSNSLIKQGAYLVEKADDIMEIMGLKNIQINNFSGSIANDSVKAKAAKANCSGNLHDYNVNNIEGEIIRKLNATPIDINEIITQTDLPADKILSIILKLELDGVIRRYSGNKVALI